MHHRLKPGFEADLIPLWDGERYGPFPLITCQRLCNHTATAKVITVVVSTLLPEPSPNPTTSVALGRPAYVMLIQKRTQLPVELDPNTHSESVFVDGMVDND